MGVCTGKQDVRAAEGVLQVRAGCAETVPDAHGQAIRPGSLTATAGVSAGVSARSRVTCAGGHHQAAYAVQL